MTWARSHAVQGLPWGPSYATSERLVKFIQTPGVLMMLDEGLSYRQVFMDGRPLETAPNPSWMGYSVGRWEGDTLVVESFGFNDKTWLDSYGHPHTEALRMTERYRRRDFGHMDIEVTLSDPDVYARPWTVKFNAELEPDTELLESVCNEGAHKSLDNWVGKADDKIRSQGAPKSSPVRGPYGTIPLGPRPHRNHQLTVSGEHSRRLSTGKT